MRRPGRIRSLLWVVLDCVGIAWGESRRAAARRRLDWTERLRRFRLRDLGLTEAEFHAELFGAIEFWRMRSRWRHMPRPVADFLFPYVGRTFTARWFAARPRP